MPDRVGQPGGVVGPEDAPRRRAVPVREARVLGLDEHDPLGWDAGVHLGWIADAGREDDPVGAVLDERGESSLLALRIVEAGHDEHGIALAGGRLLESGGDPAMDRVGQVVEKQPEDVRPARAQAASGGVGDVPEGESSGPNGLPGRFADPRVALQCARRCRLRRPGMPRDVGQYNTSFRDARHPIGLVGPVRRHEAHRPRRRSPARTAAQALTHRCPSCFRDASRWLVQSVARTLAYRRQQRQRISRGGRWRVASPTMRTTLARW